MYYCPESHGTIISPTAIVRQHSHLFHGYQKFVHLDRQKGNITLISREGYENVVIPLVWKNDLWYHSITQPTSLDDNGNPIQVNRLSDAAQWELWHQRLVHPGATVMQQQHKVSDGVPKLRGNAFFRCPSCMTMKLCNKRPGKHKTLGATSQYCTPCSAPSSVPYTAPETSEDQTMDDQTTNDNVNVGQSTTSPTLNGIFADDDDIDKYLDDIHLPDALPGQHFHLDFGFVRGSDFKMKTNNGEGPTITSIDGKNSYCLIVDRATRYMWVYLGNSKAPPVEPVRMVLRKFGATCTHRTVRSDQDQALGRSTLFLKMLQDEEFTPELTGVDSSAQNSTAERPHRDLAQMMRCMLFSSELGPEYWSYALVQAVYVKNRLYHSSTKLTPFQGFTGKRPDLSKLRIFGSRVYARKSGNRAAKLDNHTAEGIFLCFSATDNNVYFIDDATGRIRMGQHVIFDEAHMSVPAGKAPLAAQALQRLGYYVKESWVNDEKTKDQERTLQTSLQIR